MHISCLQRPAIAVLSEIFAWNGVHWDRQKAKKGNVAIRPCASESWNHCLSWPQSVESGVFTSSLCADKDLTEDQLRWGAGHDLVPENSSVAFFGQPQA
jgi:hypothetical protein